MVTIRNSNVTLPTRKGPARQQQGTQTETAPDYTPPRSRGFQSIPSDGVLAQLIDRALGAFSQGIVWDRGSILNVEA